MKNKKLKCIYCGKIITRPWKRKFCCDNCQRYNWNAKQLLIKKKKI